ncbi:hypothetical protein KIV45_15890 [Janthinobacterium lividum]|uniref:hypothetical protein n=1 Tax=unclassified Janthinobacterium TaxID=2610881 RepID=UPI0021861DCE|nr:MULTISPECIES: hypothetical protein [unclassified Janthinobacterium]MDN2676706.1 hypothetical protein [Janthinobacterium sp. SUN033]MDO8039506.1 hypothetical protein [Janthinobacterium sp. SUN137]MDZ5633936.1 hypothetical protein [Janthinobacterium sp. GMG1]UQV43448.1 hypothetical protein KIV45_15890 [Janthinobacterium lividum]
MPLNGYSVGRDLSLDIIGPNGPINLNQIVGFTAKPDVTDKKIKGLDGITRHLRFPDGWSGSFDLERQNNVVDDYFSTLEANYYAGLNENPATITETIQEVDGSVSQYRFLQVLLTLEDAGSFKGDDTVHQKVRFVAARRVKVS